MTFDREAFEERAAIMEYDAGMSRFQAETKAAALQGVSRWEAIGNVARRVVEGARNQRSLAGKSRQDDMSGMQSHAAKKSGPVPKRQQDR